MRLLVTLTSQVGGIYPVCSIGTQFHDPDIVFISAIRRPALAGIPALESRLKSSRTCQITISVGSRVGVACYIGFVEHNTAEIEVTRPVIGSRIPPVVGPASRKGTKRFGRIDHERRVRRITPKRKTDPVPRQQRIPASYLRSSRCIHLVRM